MEKPSDRWVPKVHPASREVEPEDPMELVAQRVEGDPEVMLDCLLQEFAGLGWDLDSLLKLFRDPAYPLLFEMRTALGDERLQRRIEAFLERTGVFRVRAVFVEEPELLSVSLDRLVPAIQGERD